MSFVNLHNHFDYSILDGAMKVEAGVSRAVELEQPAIAMTDHGSLGGVYQFWKQATAAGIKPIIGLEAYCAPDDRTHKQPVFWGSADQRGDDISDRGNYCHITLLARDVVGVQNLYRLQHEGYATGFYRKPRLDFASLGAHSAGLNCLTGCVSGHVQTALRLGQPDKAADYLAKLVDIFGEYLWVEVMDHGLEIEQRTKDGIIDLGRRFKLPFVATADAHYTREEDKDLHDTLLCIQTQGKKADPSRFSFGGNGYHLASRREMDALFSGLQGACDNSLAVTETVENYDRIFAAQTRLPKYSENEELDFERLVLAGTPDIPEYLDRATYEISVINSQGFPGYFLTLMDVMNEGRKAGIRFGPGRGSAGGSLAAYALGITTLDPIRNGLLFERFLNPERISFPDIDVDIDDARRDEFIRLVRSKFGEGHVAQVGTYGIIKSRSALRDGARVLGYPVQVGTSLVSKLPPTKFGRQPTLSELPASAGPQEVVAAARGVEGIIRNSGVHASAVIISPDDLVDLIPTKLPGGKSGLTTEFTGTELDELGYIKWDFLGLKNLGIIDECLSLLANVRGSEGGVYPQPEVPRKPEAGESNDNVSTAKHHHTWNSDIRARISLPTTFDDPKTFALLSAGKTTGVFQLDGYGMRALLRRVQPETLGDIAAVLALYRPGPMGANSHNEYASRKNGRSGVEYPHPEFESKLADILSPTYGLIVYQEQVLQTLAAVGGYTYATAGLIFDAMRKKDTEKMLAARPDFVERLKGNGYSDSAIEALWDTLVPFSDYSFGKAHSIGYATISYWTAWLKANYPREYYCSLLSKESDAEQLREYIQSAVADGVPILPPDINESQYGWTVVDDGIRLGLGSVRGISKVTYNHIDEGRPYLSMEEWWERAHSKVLNLSVLSAAVRSGAFDRLEPNREQVFANIEGLAARALADRELALQGQRRLWTGYEVLPGQPKLGLRQAWETELLGVALTTRAIRLKLRKFLSQDEWFYVKKTIESHNGVQPVDIVIGDLTTLRSVGTMTLTEKALAALEAVGLDVEEQE